MLGLGVGGEGVGSKVNILTRFLCVCYLFGVGVHVDDNDYRERSEGESKGRVGEVKRSESSLLLVMWDIYDY